MCIIKNKGEEESEEMTVEDSRVYEDPCFLYRVNCYRGKDEALRNAAYIVSMHVATMGMYGAMLLFLWFILLVGLVAFAQGCPLEGGGFPKNMLTWFAVVMCVVALGPILNAFGACLSKRAHEIYYIVAFFVMCIATIFLVIVLGQVSTRVRWDVCEADLIYSPPPPSSPLQKRPLLPPEYNPTPSAVNVSRS